MRHPRVAVTDLEARAGTRYTAATLALLRRRYPGVRFVWLMGADNLRTFHRWDRWEEIMTMVPVAVLARPGEQLRAGLSPAARRFARWRVPQAAAATLPFRRPPAWTLLSGRMLDLSSVRAPRRRGLAAMTAARSRLAPQRRSPAASPCSPPPGSAAPPAPQPRPSTASSPPRASPASPPSPSPTPTPAPAIEAWQADTALPPASVAKVLTTLYALDALGPDYRFRTAVRADGALDGGVLRGDLALAGDGDPVLDTDALGRLVAALRTAGLRAVDGRLRVAAGALPAVAAIDPDQPDTAGYNAAVAGTNLNFNRVFLAWTPGKAGPDARLQRPRRPGRRRRRASPPNSCADRAASPTASPAAARSGPSPDPASAAAAASGCRCATPAPMPAGSSPRSPPAPASPCPQPRPSPPPPAATSPSTRARRSSACCATCCATRPTSPPSASASAPPRPGAAPRPTSPPPAPR